MTAEKRATNLQETPIAISVLGSEALVNRHVLTLGDLSDGTIPSLRVAPFIGRSSALTFSMRGVGGSRDVNQPARDQSVGVYIDGVYLGRAQGLGAALYDIERIEVLRGPQGTLFGRNTEGGAVSIITKKPTGELGLDASIGVRSFNGREAVAHLNLPSFQGVSIKIDGIIQKRDGTVSNTIAGELDFNAYDRRGLHAVALWEPTSSFSAEYAFDISHDGSTPYYTNLATGGTQARAPRVPLEPERVSVASIGVPLQYSVGKTNGHRLTLDWQPLQNLTVRSISSYRELTQSQYDNNEASFSPYRPNGNFSRYSLANFDQHQYSQELQLIGKLPHLDYVAGLFYYHENVRDDAWTPNTLRWNGDGTDYTVLPTPIASTGFPDRASSAITDSVAAFGQLTYHPALLGDRLHLTAGGRYSHDRKRGALHKVNGATPVVSGVTAELPLRASAGRFDPLVTLAIDVTSDINVYGKWSTGYKSGGANSRSLTYRSFAPESVEAFELGAKAEFFDRRARLNVAAYAGDYQDIQIDFSASIATANRSTTETSNAAGKGKIRGIEADLTLAPTPGLTITASYAYTDIDIPKAPNPFRAGNPLVTVYPLYAPKHAASAAIDYRILLKGAALSLHLDGNYATGQYTRATDPTLSDRYFLMNGRIALGEMRMGSNGPELQLSLWSRNLLDKAYAFVRNTDSATGVAALFNEPRTVGMDARLTF